MAELALIAGWFGYLKNIEDRIKLMQEQFNIQTIIVTNGAEGVIIRHNGTTKSYPGFKGKISENDSSGDAFLAGFIYQLSKGFSINEVVDFALALQAFVAARSSFNPMYTIHDINELIAGEPKKM